MNLSSRNVIEEAPPELKRYGRENDTVYGGYTHVPITGDNTPRFVGGNGSSSSAKRDVKMSGGEFER